MPNNLVFNQVANELKTAIYGSNDGSTFTPIKTLTTGEVLVTGTVAISNTLTTTKDTATDSLLNTVVTTATEVLTENTMNRSMYSYYVKTAANSDTVIAYIEVSPTTTDAYFAADSSAIVTIPADSTAVLVPKTYLNYTRLSLSALGSATVTAYYNAQS